MVSPQDDTGNGWCVRDSFTENGELKRLRCENHLLSLAMAGGVLDAQILMPRMRKFKSLCYIWVWLGTMTPGQTPAG